MTMTSQTPPRLSDGPVPEAVFPCCDEETGLPYIKPLSDLAEVWAWRPLDHGCVSTVPLRGGGVKCSEGGRERPRTLVCHDMAGGYLDDRYVQGVQHTDCYRFTNWAPVDLFVYFSHHFVTIPPPCWTTAAHRNGVQVLGTVITEWKPGQELCKGFLGSQRAWFVARLVEIAKFYQFEGWLINIENEIALEDVQSLVSFVRELTDEMHCTIPGSVVIWYDSVTVGGALDWQNELNDQNREYFDACDGIFLNYTWKEDNLERSAETAGSRLSDVYVGLDVFGRGMKGGGGFNTTEALKDARSFGLSSAIFAQGWVYQKLPQEHFVANDRKFWDLLEPDCTLRTYETLPVATTFCQGWGLAYHLNGEVVSHQPWTNMSLQSLQAAPNQNLVSYDNTRAFSGGGCLKIQPGPKDVQTVDLVANSNILLSHEETYFVACTSQGAPASKLALKLLCDNKCGHKCHILACGDEHASFVKKLENAGTMTTVWPRDSDDILIQPDHPASALATPGGTTPSWDTYWYSINLQDDSRLNSLSLAIDRDGSHSDSAVYVGALRIFAAEHAVRPGLSNLRVRDVTTATRPGLTLTWDCDRPVDHFVVFQDLGGDWEFVGATALTAYRVCDTRCDGDAGKLRFGVQAICLGGMCTKERVVVDV